MFIEGLFPLEGRSLEVANTIILTSYHGSKRTGRLKVNRVYWLGRAHNFAHTGARIGAKNVAELFAAFPAHKYALIVARPLQVFDSAWQGLILVFEYVLLVGGVPNADFARRIRWTNVEARWWIFGYLYGLCVLGVYVAIERVVDWAYEHAVAIHVQVVFTFGIRA